MGLWPLGLRVLPLPAALIVAQRRKSPGSGFGDSHRDERAFPTSYGSGQPVKGFSPGLKDFSGPIRARGAEKVAFLVQRAASPPPERLLRLGERPFPGQN